MTWRVTVIVDVDGTEDDAQRVADDMGEAAGKADAELQETFIEGLDV